MHLMFRGFDRKTVIVTGHTGFKGAWLGFWLSRIGAKVHGLSLPPEAGSDNLYTRLCPHVCASSRMIDIRDYPSVLAAFQEIKPDAVFHLAAQALVRRSYADPLESFSTNVMGTANVLEAARQLDKAPAVVCVTTDKVYDNVDWHYPYRETDTICGKDPYSASKAAAEMVAASYARVMNGLGRDAGPRLAIARGGNVIGGGDWAEDRIVPDAVRSALAGVALRIRNPDAVRPWQHVLELCHGYMALAEGMMSDTPTRYEGAWNFGPDPSTVKTVYELASQIKDAFQVLELAIETDRAEGVPEAKYLTLDTFKAARVLGWRPALSVDECIELTANWYDAAVSRPEDIPAITAAQIDAYAKRRSGSAS